MSQTNFFEDMPVQKVNNFLVITYSSHGEYRYNIGQKEQKIKKNAQVLTNKAQKWGFVSNL